jgi:hypothetical protein
MAGMIRQNCTAPHESLTSSIQAVAKLQQLQTVISFNNLVLADRDGDHLWS